MILIPKYRDLIVPVRTVQQLGGFYKMEAVNVGDGRRRILADWFPNLITTLGRDNWGVYKSGQGFGGGPAGYCSVGTGNNAPSVADTALQTRLATTSTLQSQSQGSSGTGGPTYYGFQLKQFSFAAGTATGNLSEVGMGLTSNGLSLFSRALILDGMGAPTTITVLSNEALYVSYQLNNYAPTADVTGNVTIAGVVYAYVLRADSAGSASWAADYTNDAGILFNGSAYNGTIGALTGGPSGASSAADTVTSNAYSAGSYQRTGTLQWGLNAGNVAGGVTAIDFRFIGQSVYQMSFSPAIPKDASHVLSLNVGHSWLNNSP
jgi:hypothetical protein